MAGGSCFQEGRASVDESLLAVLRSRPRLHNVRSHGSEPRYLGGGFASLHTDELGTLLIDHASRFRAPQPA